MASTTFVDYSTVVPAAWLNDVNNFTYNGVFTGTAIKPTVTSTQELGTSILEWLNIYTVQIQRFSAGTLTINAANAAGNIALRTAGFDRIMISQTGNTVLPVASSGVTFAVAGGIQETGNVTLGYATGSGGTVTQITSKATTVTLNRASGSITLINTALAANTTVTFQVTNSTVSAVDAIIVNLAGAVANGEAYNFWVSDVSSGSFRISIRNITGGSLSEAVRLNFSVIKGSNA